MNPWRDRRTVFVLVRNSAVAIGLWFAASQSLADEVEGWWQSWDSLLYVEVQEAEARIFAAGILNPSEVEGELVTWSLAEPLLDAENPKPQLRSRSLLGLEIGEGLRKRGHRWQGDIYDPRSGAWYKSHMSAVDGQLKIRGYIGTPMLGKTRVFERYQPCKEYEDKAMVIWSGAKPPVCTADAGSTQ